MKMEILSGISGIGKSFYVRATRMASIPCDTGVYSADHYFTDRHGNYPFDPSKLPQAHQQCFRRVLEAAQRSVSDIVVDNTNTTVAEIAPYVLLGESFGYEVSITKFASSWDDVKVCAERNEHGVSFHAICEQQRRITSMDMPPWWRANLIGL